MGEISGLSLALQWLADKRDLQIGWDHLNGVKQAHYQIPGTTCRGRPEAMTAECLPVYHHNPHMATALALLEKAGLDNRRRTIKHTSAHGLDQELEEQDIQIKPTWQEKTRTYVVNHSTLKEIRRVMDGMEARNGHQPDNLVMLNALADWGAKQVTIHGKKDGPHLLRPALTPGNYMVTTPDGDIQLADEAFLRKGVAKRIRRQLLESCMARKPGKYDIKGNTKGLWERETDHMLSRPTWPESLPRLLVQFVSGSIRYNGEIATEYPEILRYSASLGGKPTRLSTKCPLYVEAQARNPGEDTKDHLFREFPETKKERVALKRHWKWP
jgi:hypothetical protein